LLPANFQAGLRVLVRGGGDLGSGVAIRLHRVGVKILISELAQPLFVRRLVSFGEAVYSGSITVEEVTAYLAEKPENAINILNNGGVAVLVDPEAEVIKWFHPQVVVDARLLKQKPEYKMDIAPLVIGLGPGFLAGEDCHAVIETKRGPTLGRVYWQGASDPDTRIPETVGGFIQERVLRAPCDGPITNLAKIGDLVKKNQTVARVGDEKIITQFDGILRGLIADNIVVKFNMKVGDLDPRLDPRLCTWVSDKSLAIGGAVVEAILSRPELRRALSGCN